MTISVALDAAGEGPVVGLVPRPFQGRSKRIRHVIADILYTSEDGPCLSQCSCGAAFEAATPEDLERLWVEHRGLQLQRWSVLTPRPKAAPTFARCGIDGCELRRDGRGEQTRRSDSAIPQRCMIHRAAG